MVRPTGVRRRPDAQTRSQNGTISASAGHRAVATVGETQAELRSFAPEVVRDHAAIRRLQGHMHRRAWPTTPTAILLSDQKLLTQAGESMWYLHTLLEQYGNLREGINAYNGIPYAEDEQSGAYGVNVLWLAYGNAWASASGIDYIGQYMATGPSGTQMRLVTNGDSKLSVYEPGFSVPSQQWNSNYGTNSAGKRVLLLANGSDLVSYVDCLLVEQWLHTNGYIQAFLTGVAAYSAYSSAEVNVDCVIAVGADAIATIKDQGYTLTQYSGFGDWEDGSGLGNPGFIGATGYSGTLSVVEDACSNGWS